MTPRLPRLVIPAAAALALSGCLSFGATPPPTLMTLNAAAPEAVGTGGIVPANSAVTLFTPTVPQELASARVPVRSSTTQFAYIKGAQWIDVPARLFRSLLAETVTARTGRAVLEARDYHLSPGPRLSGRLVAFGVDAAGPTAVVTYDAIIQRDDKAIETKRFESRVPIASVTVAPARNGLNQAANDVATQVADWVGRP